LKAEPEVFEEIKDGIRAEIEGELLSEQQHLMDEINKHKEEVSSLHEEKSALQSETTQLKKNALKEKQKITREQKKFTAMQEKFKPRVDDLERINKIQKEAKPSVLGGKITVAKDDWDFIVRIARQHARISEATLAALENHNSDTAKLRHCQSLHLAIASEVASITHYGVKSKLKRAVQDVLNDIVDSSEVSWAIDDMLGRKPSTAPVKASTSHNWRFLCSARQS